MTNNRIAWDDYKKNLLTPEQMRAAMANYKPQSTNESSGYLDNLIGGAGSSFIRGYGDIAEFVNWKSASDYLNGISNEIDNGLGEARPADFSSLGAFWNWFTDPRGGARATGNTVGSIASIFAPGGVAKGVSLLGKFQKAQNLLNKFWVQGMISGVPEAAMETGNFERNAVASGMSPEEARQRSWGVFGRNLPFLMASNAAQTFGLGKIIGKNTGLKNRALLSGAELGTQGWEEGMQQGFQNEMLGKDYSYNPVNWFNDPRYEEQAQAFKEGIAGFLVPTLFGFGGGVLRDRLNRPNPEQVQQQNDFITPTQEERDRAVEEYFEEKSRRKAFVNAMQGENPSDVNSLIQDLMNGEQGQSAAPELAFDLTRESPQDAKLFEDFVAQKIKDPETKIELTNMLDDNGKFINNAKNRDTIMQKYGDEVYQFAANKNLAEIQSQQQAAPAEIKSPAQTQAPKIETKAKNLKAAQSKANKFLRNDNLITSLKPVREQAIQNSNTNLLAEIESAIRNGDAAAIQKILDDAGVELTEKTEQTQETKSDTSTKESSRQERLVRVREIANRPISKDGAVRKLQGKALLEILRQNNLNAEKIEGLKGALEKGYTKAVRQVQAALRQLNYLPQVEKQQNRTSLQEQKAQDKLNEQARRKLENAIRLAGDSISQVLSNRQRQGKAINYVADKNNVNLPEGLSQALNDGYGQAITLGQELLRNAGISIGYGEERAQKKSSTVNPSRTFNQNNVENASTDIESARRLGRELEILANGRRLELPEGLVSAAKEGNTEALKTLREYVNNPNTNTVSKPATQNEVAPQAESQTAPTTANTQVETSSAKEKFYKTYRAEEFPVFKEYADNLSDEKLEQFSESNPTEKELLDLAFELLERKYPKAEPTRANYEKYFSQNRTRLAKKSELEKQVNRNRNKISAKQAYQEFEKFLQEENFGEDSAESKSAQSENSKSVVKVTGNEFGEYSSLKELRQKAKEFYRENLRGTSIRNPILGEVELTDDTIMFTNSGLNKMGSSSAQEEKLLLVRHLPELIETADKISSRENTKDKRNASQYSYLHSTAEINNKIEDVNITIFTDSNGNKYYNHNIVSAGQSEKDLPVHSAQVTNDSDGIPTIDKPSTETIAQTQESSKENAQTKSEGAENNSGNFELFEDIDSRDQKYFSAKIKTGADSMIDKGISGENFKKLSELAEKFGGKNYSVVNEHNLREGEFRFKNATDRSNFINDNEVDKILLRESNRQARERLEQQAARQAEEQKQNEYRELVDKALRGEKLTDAERQEIVDNRNLLEVNGDLREGLYKKFPEIKQFIDRLFSAVKRADYTRRMSSYVPKWLAELTAVDKSKNQAKIYPYAADKLGRLWNTEHATDRKAKDKRDKLQELDKQFRDKEMTGQEYYAKTLKLLHNRVEKVQQSEVTSTVEGTSKTYDNRNDAEEKALIKAILDAPVGTEIISRNGVGEPGYYRITQRGNEKMITATDEKGNRSNKPSIKLNRANVKEYFGAGRVSGNKLRTGEVTVIKPESLGGTKQAPRRAKLEGVAGRKAIINLGNGEKFNVRYLVVEADELIASNNADGTVNNNYPDEGLQPRNRSTQVMIEQMQRIAKHPDVEELLDLTNNPNKGAPVVRNDGVALNGNGRIAGLQESYRLESSENRNNIDEYRQEILSRAADFGLESRQVAKIKNPVLVREVTDELSRDELSKVTGNTEGGAKFNSEEQARTDADKITPNLFEYYKGGLKNDLKAKENAEFVVKVLQGISSKEEFSRYFDSQNNLDAKGEERVRQALLYYAFESDKIVANSSATRSEGKALQNALEDNAASFAKAKAQNYSLDTSAVGKAAEKYFKLKSQGRKIADYLSETETATVQDSAEVRELLSAFDAYTKKSSDLRAFIGNIAEGIEREESDNFLEILRESREQIDNPVEDYSFGEEVEEKSARTEELDGGLFSAKGKVSTTLKDILNNLVDEQDLTSQQKKFVEYGKEIRMPTKFFKGEEKFYGYHGEDGVSYLNVNAKADWEKTFWHEATHWMAKYNPELLRKIENAAEITWSQRRAKRNSANTYKNCTDAELEEEILADNMKDFAERGMLLQKIGRQDRNLLEKVISYLKALMDKFASYFHNAQGGLTNRQRDAMYNEFAKNIRSLTDAYGNKLYKVHNRTHDIYYVSGGLLPRYSFAGEKAKTADLNSLKRAKALEKQGKNRDEIFKETGWFKGRDNRWRFEIPDNLDKIDVQKLAKQEKGNALLLSDVYENPALYKAYSWLKEVAVVPSSLRSGVRGAAHFNESMPENSYIQIDAKGLKEEPSVLVHEIQHLIQGYEDFARGGSSKNISADLQAKYKNYPSWMIYDKLGGEQESREIQSRAEERQSYLRRTKRLESDAEVAREKVNSEYEKLSPQEQKLFDEYRALKEKSKNAPVQESLALDKKIREIDKKLPQSITQALSDLSLSEGQLLGEQKRFQRNQSTPTPHASDAIIVFGGKNYSLSRNTLDNAAKKADNTSDKIFKKYLGDGIMKMVSETVEKEIGEHVNISKMSDPVERDKARDKLPYIRRLLTQYNSNTIQNIEDRKNFYATKIEYARRCFDNDERIRKATFKQVVGNEGQSGVRGNRNEIRPDNNTKGNGRIVREVNGGVSRNVSGEINDARKHFLELYNSETRHSSRGAFSVAPDNNSREGFLHKVGNVLSTIWSGKKTSGNEYIQREITKRLQEVSGYMIHYRKFTGDNSVTMDTFNKIIRSKKNYDWENLLPKAGLGIAEDLNITRSEEMGNYIASWLLTGEPNNNSAQAKEFAQAMQSNPDQAEILLKIQSKFKEIAEMSPLEKYKAQIVHRAPSDSKTPMQKFDTVYEEVFDDLDPLNVLVKKLGKQYGKKIEELLLKSNQTAVALNIVMNKCSRRVCKRNSLYITNYKLSSTRCYCRAEKAFPEHKLG